MICRWCLGHNHDMCNGFVGDWTLSARCDCFDVGHRWGEPVTRAEMP